MFVKLLSCVFLFHKLIHQPYTAVTASLGVTFGHLPPPSGNCICCFAAGSMLSHSTCSVKQQLFFEVSNKVFVPCSSENNLDLPEQAKKKPVWFF